MKVQAIAVLAAVSVSTTTSSSYHRPVRKGSANGNRQSAIHRTLQEKEVPSPDIPGVEPPLKEGEPPLKDGEPVPPPPVKEGEDAPPMKEGDDKPMPPHVKEGDGELVPPLVIEGDSPAAPLGPPTEGDEDALEDGEFLVDGILFQPQPEEAIVNVVETTVAPIDQVIKEEMSMATFTETTVAAEITEDEMSMPEFEMSIETVYDNTSVEDNLIDNNETTNTAEVEVEIPQEEPTDDKFAFAVDAALEEEDSR